jgi:hypothetical protein
LLFLGGIGRFQWVTGEKIKKFSLLYARVPGCGRGPEIRFPCLSLTARRGAESNSSSRNSIAQIQFFVKRRPPFLASMTPLQAPSRAAGRWSPRTGGVASGGKPCPDVAIFRASKKVIGRAADQYSCIIVSIVLDSARSVLERAANGWQPQEGQNPLRGPFGPLRTFSFTPRVELVTEREARLRFTGWYAARRLPIFACDEYSLRSVGVQVSASLPIGASPGSLKTTARRARSRCEPEENEYLHR